MEHGIKAMMGGLEALGAMPVVRHGLVTFAVTPISGAHAQQMVETGVAEAEVQRWPATPPHWVHLPGDITIPRSNTRASPHPGWLMHSRDCRGWARETNHAMAWLAHVRSVLAEATS